MLLYFSFRLLGKACTAAAILFDARCPRLLAFLLLVWLETGSLVAFFALVLVAIGSVLVIFGVDFFVLLCFATL